MLFLSENEKTEWKNWSDEILANQYSPGQFDERIRPNLIPVFYFYVGTLLTARGCETPGIDWIRSGAMLEEEGFFSNVFLLSFLERQNGRLIMPAVAFADPAPFIHFAGVPILKQARENFIVHCCHSLPVFKRPFRIMDIGCGDGALVTALLKRLLKVGRISEIAEILLIDSSPAMCELAGTTVGKVFPSQIIKAVNSKIQDFSEKIEGKYDLAMSSLAYHHMPIEIKIQHLKKLSQKFDHFIIFEMDANNDTPELHSPDLALSVYQSYGRIIDYVFLHDAPVKTALDCVDCFLMTEEVSFLTQPRGVRTDYHMLRSQWHDLFKKALGNEFACRCDSTAYSDEYLNLFTMHYGK